MDILNQTVGYKRSGKYKAIATEAVLTQLKAKGFLVNQVIETKPRKAERLGFQKHMVRLQHVDQITADTAERLELILVNSADGTTSLKFMIGVFRMVCANGLIVGDKSLEYRVRHVGNPIIAIDEAVENITTNYPLIAARVEAMKNRFLSPSEVSNFAYAASNFLTPKASEEVSIASLLRTRRMADSGDDLWKVFNRVQESALRGGIEYLTTDKDKNRVWRRTRHIRGVDSQIKTNQKLWNLAETLLAA